MRAKSHAHEEGKIISIVINFGINSINMSNLNGKNHLI